jgi:hypothetical protein
MSSSPNSPVVSSDIMVLPASASSSLRSIDRVAVMLSMYAEFSIEDSNTAQKETRLGSRVDNEEFSRLTWARGDPSCR